MKSLWLFLTLTVPFGTNTAPVYTYFSDGILKRTGTFTYKQNEGIFILYCIATPPKVKLNCVVQTPAALVLIEATATEQGT